MFGLKAERIKKQEKIIANIEELRKDIHGGNRTQNDNHDRIRLQYEEGLLETVSLQDKIIRILKDEIKLLVFRLDHPEEYASLLEAHRANEKLNEVPQPPIMVSSFTFEGKKA